MAYENDLTSPPASTYWRRFWVSEIPHFVVLALTVVGIGCISLLGWPLRHYWEVLAVVICAVSIYAGWRTAWRDKARWRLVWTQVLHWGAFLAAMRLVFLPSVQAIADVDSTNLMVLMLLALGTFVAGVHAPSWRMALNGAVMGISVPAVAWLDRSALALTLALLLLVPLSLALAWFHFRHRAA